MDSMRGEKRDIHVSICHSEGFCESRRTRNEAQLIVENGAVERCERALPAENICVLMAG